MSNLTDFFPSGGGGGLTPKFQEFNSSGTFTPSQALIDAGGYIEVFLVGGGGSCNNGAGGGEGGEVLIKKMYLTSTTPLPVSIGAGGLNSDGGNSTFNGITAKGGDGTWVPYQQSKIGASWGAYGTTHNAGSGVLGYGAGGSVNDFGGVRSGKANSGQGGQNNYYGGSGYCLIKWYE